MYAWWQEQVLLSGTVPSVLHMLWLALCKPWRWWRWATFVDELLHLLLDWSNADGYHWQYIFCQWAWNKYAQEEYS